MTHQTNPPAEPLVTLDPRPSPEDLAKARNKLLALAGALTESEESRMRFRVTEDETTHVKRKILRVWDARRLGKSETVACQELPEGWRFFVYPYGPVLADADGVTNAENAHAAAQVIARHVERLP